MTFFQMKYVWIEDVLLLVYEKRIKNLFKRIT